MPCSLSDVRLLRSAGPEQGQALTCRSYEAVQPVKGKRSDRDYARPPIPATWPTDPAQEKGIDVALAIDFVRLAITGAYDVGVMMSTDTDLLPALRFVYDYDLGVIHAAVAAWGIPTDSRRLRLP